MADGYFEDVFGKGVKLKEITVEMTDGASTGDALATLLMALPRIREQVEWKIDLKIVFMQYCGK